MKFFVACLVILNFLRVIAYDKVMVWMCLEFCDETGDQITSNLRDILQHTDVVDAVSFEKYTLGPNSTLVDNNLTSVSWKINAAGNTTILLPLLSVYTMLVLPPIALLLHQVQHHYFDTISQVSRRGLCYPAILIHRSSLTG